LSHTTNEKLDAYLKREREVYLAGGEKSIQKQHDQGKLTARERIEILFDPGTFQEIHRFAQHSSRNYGMDKKKLAADGVIIGSGTIDGRLVYAFSQDFTVAGGSVGLRHGKKIEYILQLAQKSGAPVIGINDSGGARIQEGIASLVGYGKIFYQNTIASGVIPQVSIISGPCAGGAAYSPAITDFIIMVRNTAQMFITGPTVIKAVTGEDITGDALGGAQANNSISGNAHFIAETDEEAVELAKQILSYSPSNNMEYPPRPAPTGEIEVIEDETLDAIIPDESKQAYDMYEVIHKIIDHGDFLEVHAHFAKNIIVGFARIDGHSVGIIANQPKVLAGSLDIDASDKSARFIRYCNCFNIPLITLVDVPGFLPGVKQEHGGIIRHGAKMLFAYSYASVPKITVILRKAYGGAFLAMCSKEQGADYSFAWPTAEIAVMGAQGAVDVLFRKEIKEAEDKNTERSKRIEEYEDKFNNPWIAAEEGYIDDVILPRQTKKYISISLANLINKREHRPRKRHGNIPL
jgi:methylmalonyl-CoA decarboxylase subunit alpha